MDSLSKFLNEFPVVTFAFVALVVVGAVLTIGGTLTFGEYVDHVQAIGIGLGVIGAARMLGKIGPGK